MATSLSLLLAPMLTMLHLKQYALALQIGGAAGTLAALSDKGWKMSLPGLIRQSTFLN